MTAYSILAILAYLCICAAVLALMSANGDDNE